MSVRPIQKLHYHYFNGKAAVLTYAQSADFIQIESISIHTSYLNISAEIGNNKLFYDPAQLAITLSDGFYDLSSLNKLLLTTLSPLFYKIVVSFGSQNFIVYKYSTSSDWINEINGVSQSVQTFSKLNDNIYDGTFFCNILRADCNMLNSKTTIESTNQLDEHNEIEVIITAPKMSYQTLYFNPPISYEFTKTSTLSLRFTDYNNNVIKFNPLF